DQHIFVAATEEEALQQARAATGNPNLTLADLRQDDDVVDTWFSSWLWPISVFDGFENQEELRYYYPTNVLVTGWDIMFFWVARMIMAGYEWSPALLDAETIKQKGAMPFHDVYFTGMVRDNKRRKMSKSLGNSPDALELIDQYGADGVRFGMLASAAAGNDIIFDAPFDPANNAVLNESKLCEQGRNFCNKMWNALRLIKGWEVQATAPDAETAAINHLAGRWMEQRLSQTLEQLGEQFTGYRLSESLMTLYKLIWDDFCSWYLEMIKPAYGGGIDAATLETTLAIFEKLLTALHPFMPFVTEEIWHQLRERPAGEDCVISRYPTPQPFDQAFLQRVEEAKQAITSIREIRNNNGIKMKEELRVFAQDSPTVQAIFREAGLQAMLLKMGSLASLEIAQQDQPNTVAFLAGTAKFFVELNQEIDVEEERSRLEKEREYYQGFIASVQKKLSNERFVAGAPAEVVDRERQKLADGEAKLQNIEEALGKLTQ
ncbi:MAG: class I tRNA ligase family protein, partial [Lewinellaceae bacterium]|nr:class I tRNA ligase family protein [Lewinellaceae bacterium]